MLPLALLAVALHAPQPAHSAVNPDAVASLQHIDAASALAGPLAPALAYLAPAERGGAEVSLYNENTRESLTVFLRFDGVTDAETAKTVKEFLRCKRTGRKRTINAGVLGMFAQLASHYPGKTIEIVSAVRAKGFGVKDSKHYTGHAIDFRVRGVKTREVRDLAWTLDREMGVGFYKGEDFLHIDHRPGEKKIGWEQRRQGSPNRYNPKWARTGADDDQVRHSRASRPLRSAEPRW